MYDYSIDDFDKIVEFTSVIFGVGQPNFHGNNTTYSNWLYLVMCILTGVVKAKKNEREEVRLLFQNRYSEENAYKSGIYMIYQEDKCILIVLGLDTETDNGKRKVELKLDKAFNSTLIPSVIVGDQFESISELHLMLKEANLDDIIIAPRY